MKAFFILVVVAGCLGWMFWNVGSQSFSIPKEVMADAPKPTAPPAAKPVPVISKPEISDDASIPLSFRERAFREGTPSVGLRKKFYDALSQITPMRLFKANVMQHLDDGDLLVEVWTIMPGQSCVPRGVYAIFGIPGAEKIVDQMEIDCMVLPVGVYQYTSVDGARRTIYEMIYRPSK
jgi:hypothetical protein